jgi:integrase
MAKGSLFKEVAKDGTVSWRVRVDMVDPVTGKRRQPQRTFKTKREAERGLAQWLVEIERGTAVNASKMTVAELLRDWLATYAQHHVRPTTLDDYEVTIRVQLIPGLGSIPIQKLTPAHLQRFYADKLEAGHSPRVVQLCHRRLSQALDYALTLGLVARNVADAVTPPRVERKEMLTWSVAQVRTFLAVADQSTYGPVWLVLLGTGMRRGEVLGLRWEDVDWDRGTLRVAQSVLPYKGIGYIQEPKSPGAWRTVPVDPVIMTALREHKGRQNERRLALGSAWRDHDLVFAAANGNPINPDNLRRDYNRLVKRAGVPRIRIHDQRHTHVTLALQAGAPMGAISKRVGHSRTSVTMDLYAHVTQDMQREAANTINAMLFGAT